MNKRVKPAMAGVLLACALPFTWAQTGNGLDNPDWVEGKEPPPPTFSAEHPLLLDMPSYMSVRIGIDPATISVGEDGVVRYVAVMRNATGSINAVYEGIRCASYQVKTYARAGTSGEWSLMNTPAWRDLNDNQPSRHAFVFARTAACNVRTSNSLREILQYLKGEKSQLRTRGRLRVDD